MTFWIVAVSTLNLNNRNACTPPTDVANIETQSAEVFERPFGLHGSRSRKLEQIKTEIEKNEQIRMNLKRKLEQLKTQKEKKLEKLRGTTSKNRTNKKKMK